MNQMKNRMQALGLLDRAFKATTDEELTAAVEALDDDHREGLESFVDDLEPDTIRAAVKAGRIDGGMEAIAAILSDASLADCIEQLGDSADNPSSDELREVLPGITERHGVGLTRIMLAATVAGEAPASAIIRDLLKSDDLVALPEREEPQLVAPVSDAVPKRSDEEQAELRAKRAAARKAKQEAQRTRREQSAAARRKK